MIDKIQHLGIAVRDLDGAVAFFRDVLGLPLEGFETVEEQQVKTAIFQVGETKIELLATTSPEGPVGKFIEKRGEGIHHVCFKVQDIEEAISVTSARGVRMIDAEPKSGVHGTRVAFIHPKDTFGVLIEYAEEEE
ncbi:MAG: methylmalonyl-CoA epimerase [Deltaproteobacteria bacterium]|nr:methylmalonyl-CoA epimerase [Deltaproteobacteria bacterium]